MYYLCNNLLKELHIKYNFFKKILYYYLYNNILSLFIRTFLSLQNIKIKVSIGLPGALPLPVECYC